MKDQKEARSENVKFEHLGTAMSEYTKADTVSAQTTHVIRPGEEPFVDYGENCVFT